MFIVEVIADLSRFNHIAKLGKSRLHCCFVQLGYLVFRRQRSLREVDKESHGVYCFESLLSILIKSLDHVVQVKPDQQSL